VCEEKDTALTTGQSVPAPKDGEQLVNSEEGTIVDAPEPLAEQQDIDFELKQWKDYLLRGKRKESKRTCTGKVACSLKPKMEYCSM